MSSESFQSSTFILREFLGQPSTSQACERFVHRYWPRMTAYCQSLGLQQADAEDIAADILLRCLRDDRFLTFSFQGKAAFNGYLATSIRRAASNHRRTLARRREQGVEEELDQLTAEIADSWEVEHADMIRDVHAILTRLKREGVFQESSIQIFERMVINGETASQAASACGVTIAAAYKAKGRIVAAVYKDFQSSKENGQ